MCGGVSLSGVCATSSALLGPDPCMLCPPWACATSHSYSTWLAAKVFTALECRWHGQARRQTWRLVSPARFRVREVIPTCWDEERARLFLNSSGLLRYAACAACCVVPVPVFKFRPSKACAAHLQSF